MSRKRKHAPALAETVAAPPPAEPLESPGSPKSSGSSESSESSRSSEGDGLLGGPSPAGREEFADDTGRRWRKVRGPLHPRLAKRLVAQADEFVIGEGGGERFRHVASGDRLPAWQAVKDRLDSELTPSYRAFEFRSADGTTLLYIEESC
jgi:hypothetical protein